MSIGYVYKIYDNTNGNVYYGSTKQALSKRMAVHKSHYKLWCAGKRNNVTAFDIIKNGDYDISLVEEGNFKDKIELHRRERFYIENNVCVNKYIPTRTNQEYRKDNKETMREWRKKNRETINEKLREWREKNRETIREKEQIRREDNRETINEKSREWREKNKETIREKSRKWYEDNKEKSKEKSRIYRETISEKGKEKMTCSCGLIFRKDYQKRHDKSPKHLNFMKEHSIS